MESIFIIAMKDLKQIIRDRKTFLFLLIMPIMFTFLFGIAFRQEPSSNKETRLPVGIINLDANDSISDKLLSLLDNSTIIHLESGENEQELAKLLEDEKITAYLVIPQGYGVSMATDQPKKLVLVANTSSVNGLNTKNEINAQANRLVSAVRIAQLLVSSNTELFSSIITNVLEQWQNPPVQLVKGGASFIDLDELAHLKVEEAAISKLESNAYAHSSPSMILQFAVAGLLTCAQVIVSERKSRCLQRLLTTSTSRTQILLGHYLAIFLLILMQFATLILFGQFVLKLAYFSQPLAILITAVTAALCVAAMGLLIGVLAKKEEQAISFSLIAMFVLSGAGGAWVPLEYTGKTFQAIGSVTPLAWGMTGFENVLIRGLGVESVWLPAVALLGYTLLFFILAAVKFRSE